MHAKVLWILFHPRPFEFLGENVASVFLWPTAPAREIVGSFTFRTSQSSGSHTRTCTRIRLYLSRLVSLGTLWTLRLAAWNTTCYGQSHSLVGATVMCVLTECFLVYARFVMNCTFRYLLNQRVMISGSEFSSAGICSIVYAKVLKNGTSELLCESCGGIRKAAVLPGGKQTKDF